MTRWPWLAHLLNVVVPLAVLLAIVGLACLVLYAYSRG